MTEAEARSFIEFETNWDVGKGPLTTEDIDQLLEWSKRTDADGLDPDDANWTETFDVYAAAARGCRKRARNLADSFDVKLGAGREFSRFQTPTFWIERANELEAGPGAGVAGGVFTAQLRTVDSACF